jgi:hypothetical protein
MAYLKSAKMDEHDYFWRLTNTPGYWQDAARDLVYGESPQEGLSSIAALLSLVK